MKLLIVGLLLSATSAFAQNLGGHDGGGGKGLVCYGAQNEIVSVELLDFYEGSMLESLTILERSGNFKEIYNEVIKKSINRGVLDLMKKGTDIEKGFKFLSPGARLTPVNDSSEIFIPSNCKLEQLANFQGLSRIFIVRDFWDKMSETSRAGLVMHEHLWWIERRAGAVKSSRARRTVARFFADQYQFEKDNYAPKKGDVVCYSVNPDAPSNRRSFGTSFIVSKIPQSNNCEVHFDTLNGIIAFTKQTAIWNDCSDWAPEIIWPSESDRYMSELSSTLEVYSGPENIWSHQISLSMKVEREPQTNQLKKEFTLQVFNQEFPGFDEKEMAMECQPLNHEPPFESLN